MAESISSGQQFIFVEGRYSLGLSDIVKDEEGEDDSGSIKQRG